jgi:hypothetical protein
LNDYSINNVRDKIESTITNEMNQLNSTEVQMKEREVITEIPEKMDSIPKMLKCFICDGIIFVKKIFVLKQCKFSVVTKIFVFNIYATK